MSKPKIEYKTVSWGIYNRWDKMSKALPKIIKHTDTIPAQMDIEFGYIINIRKAKGKKIVFTIEHPPFPDKNGKPEKAFTGELYVRTNDWDFFLGDTIWTPVEDKIGEWRLITELEGEVIEEKTFYVVCALDKGMTSI